MGLWGWDNGGRIMEDGIMGDGIMGDGIMGMG